MEPRHIELLDLKKGKGKRENRKEAAKKER
jgi:hypothetical protein